MRGMLGFAVFLIAIYFFDAYFFDGYYFAKIGELLQLH